MPRWRRHLVSERRTPSVKIEQPLVNKATAFTIAAVSGFFAFMFLTRIASGVLNLILIAILAGALVFAYKAIQVIAIADAEGIEVHNLIRKAHLPWTSIDTLTVGAVGSENALGITIELANGSSVPIEASSGPWYQKTLSAETVERCDQFIERVDTLRTNATNAAERTNLEASDSLKVRVTVAEDADAVAETITKPGTRRMQRFCLATRVSKENQPTTQAYCGSCSTDRSKAPVVSWWSVLERSLVHRYSARPRGRV
jgi:hypothetical protein